MPLANMRAVAAGSSVNHPGYYLLSALEHGEVEALDPDHELALLREPGGGFVRLSLRDHSRVPLPGLEVQREDNGGWFTTRNTSATCGAGWFVVVARNERWVPFSPRASRLSSACTTPREVQAAAWHVDTPSEPRLLYEQPSSRRVLGFRGATVVILEGAPTRQTAALPPAGVLTWNLERDSVRDTRRNPAAVWARAGAIELGDDMLTVVDALRRPAGAWRRDGSPLPWAEVHPELDRLHHVFEDQPAPCGLASFTTRPGLCLVDLPGLTIRAPLEPPPGGWSHLFELACASWPGGDHIILAERDTSPHHGCIGVWDIEGRFVRWIGPRGSSVVGDHIYAELGPSLCLHPDGRRVLFSVGWVGSGREPSESVEIWDTATGERVGGLAGPSRIVALRVSASGERIAASVDHTPDHNSDLLTGTWLWVPHREDPRAATTSWAYDPRHPQRGDQPLVRARLVGTTVAVDRGGFTHWTLGRAKDHGDEARARAAFCAKLEAWNDRGLALARDGFELHRALSLRNPALEAELRRSDDLPASAEIYADWLQAQGDPRGLVTLTNGGFEGHAGQLFGPLAPFVDALGLVYGTRLVEAIELDDAPARLPGLELGALELLERVLALPVCACLRRLKLRGWWLASSRLPPILAHESLGGLRELSLSVHDQLELFGLRALERLERLELLGLTRLELPALPRLRAMKLGFSGTAARALLDLRACELPALDTLEVELRGIPASEEHDPLIELLRAPALASVRTLRLTSLHYYGSGLSDARVARLAAVPQLASLAQLDLRGIVGTLPELEPLRELLGPRLLTPT